MYFTNLRWDCRQQKETKKAWTSRLSTERASDEPAGNEDTETLTETVQIEALDFNFAWSLSADKVPFPNELLRASILNGTVALDPKP